MIITYNIGSLSARLKLTALRARHGGVVREGLVWRLITQGSVSGHQKPEYTSSVAQPELDIPEGTYHIEVIYKEKTHLLAEDIHLAKNTLTDAVFVLDAAGEYETDAGYYADFEAATDFDRRFADRQQQEKFGHAGMPLNDPNRPKGDQGMGFQGHPLLNNAQFDGMEPKTNPQPSENEQASAKTIEMKLQQQKELGLGHNSAPTPTR